MAPDSPALRVPVHVHFGSPEYLATASMFGESGDEQQWEDLAQALYGRSGWYCAVGDTDAGVRMFWAFGALGSSRLVVEPVESGFTAYDAIADTTTTFANETELLDWLNSLGDLDPLTDMQHEMLSNNDWKLLGTTVFDLDVEAGHDAGQLIGSVRGLPTGLITGDTVSAVLGTARTAVGLALGCPPERRSDIRFRLQLSPDAAAAL